MTGHTPTLPLSVEPGDSVVDILAADGERIAIVCRAAYWEKHSQDDRDFAEFIVRSVNDHAPLLIMENAAGKVLDAVRAYLPPDGIDKDELISRVIEAVDNSEFNTAWRARASNGDRDDG